VQQAKVASACGYLELTTVEFIRDHQVMEALNSWARISFIWAEISFTVDYIRRNDLVAGLLHLSSYLGDIYGNNEQPLLMYTYTTHYTTFCFTAPLNHNS
jgi:hypothetical protein